MAKRKRKRGILRKIDSITTNVALTSLMGTARFFGKFILVLLGFLVVVLIAIKLGISPF